jgi:hypothetical protein
MTGFKEILSYFETKYFAKHVELGDDKCYKIEGVGFISFRLESGARLHVDEILYVPGLKKNLLSVSTLEDKGYWVILKDRKALLWAKGSHLSTTEPIGTRSGGLQVMSGQSVQELAHDVSQAPASCGTEYLDIFITKLFQIYKTWYVACPLFLLVKMKFVRDAC